MSLKDQAKSIHKRLSNIAQKRKVAFQHIMTEFLIERLLARLLHNSSLSEKLIFKGGFVAMRLYGSPRYTVDLDALADHIRGDALIETVKTAASVSIDDAAWFHFQETVDLETQGEYGGMRFIFRAGIGEPLFDLKRAQIIHLDIGFGDPVTPEPLQTRTHSLLGDEDLSWKVYPLETMIAEKLQALMSRGALNSRSKDILDLSLFVPQADPTILKEAIRRTFHHCDTPIPQNFVEELRQMNFTVLERGWASATGNIAEAPRFEEAFRNFLESLEKKL